MLDYNTMTTQTTTHSINNKTKSVKRFSGYKKVKKTIEWKQVYNFKNSKRTVGWYNPCNNQVRWDCPQPEDHIKYEWESTAEFATNVKPIQMGTAPSWREPDARLC